MSVLTWTMPITKKIDRTKDFIGLLPCIKHGESRKMYDVYTGKKHKFQGTVIECEEEDCKIFQYNCGDAVVAWNKKNQK